jgi:hypothetical protein
MTGETRALIDDLASTACVCGGTAACFTCQTADALTALVTDTEADLAAARNALAACREVRAKRAGR